MTQLCELIYHSPEKLEVRVLLWSVTQLVLCTFNWLPISAPIPTPIPPTPTPAPPSNAAGFVYIWMINNLCPYPHPNPTNTHTCSALKRSSLSRSSWNLRSISSDSISRMATWHSTYAWIHTGHFYIYGLTRVGQNRLHTMNIRWCTIMNSWYEHEQLIWAWTINMNMNNWYEHEQLIWTWTIDMSTNNWYEHEQLIWTWTIDMNMNNWYEHE